VGDPFEHDVEGAQLLVTAGQLRRALAGAGRVGVPDRVHDSTVSRRLAESVDFASASRRAPPLSGNRQDMNELGIWELIGRVAVNTVVFLSVLLLV
jgi:hypothetical protein